MCVKINLPRAAALLLAAALLGFVATITLLLHHQHAERFSEPCDGNQGAGSDGYGGRTGENGVYCGQGMDNGYINVELAALLSRFLKGKTVADIGAGQGGYAKVMKAAAISVRAFDGQAGIEGFTEGLVSHADLTRPLALEPRPQWTISFEVLEHIPPHLEANFLQNVAMATEGVIISCAIVGQGGQDHINTHSNVAVRDRLAELGFVFDPRASATVRWYLHHRVMDHFSTNLMVFFRGAADNRVHSYRLDRFDRLDSNERTKAPQLLEAWLAKHRPTALTTWMQHLEKTGQIPTQRSGMIGVCLLQETSNPYRKVNAEGCRAVFGLLSVS